jgi:hypothetical protein
MGMVRLSGCHCLSSPFCLDLSPTFVFAFHCHLLQTRERKGTRRSGLRVLPGSHTAIHRGAEYLSSSASSTVVAPLSSCMARWVSGYLQR